MNKTTYQRPEIRNSSDEIIQSGAYGKNTAFCNSQNNGIFDYINNNLEWLYDNKANANNVLSTNGGTVNGMVTITGTVSTQNIFLAKLMNVDRENAPASATYPKPFTVQDMNGKLMGYIQMGVNTSNAHNFSFECIGADGKASTMSVQRYADGTDNFKFNSKEVERVEAFGANYIRYTSGLQICWGSENITAAKQFTFPVAFTSGGGVMVSSNANGYCWATGAGNTSFNFNCSNYGSGINARYIAIGRWK